MRYFSRYRRRPNGSLYRASSTNVFRRYLTRGKGSSLQNYQGRRGVAQQPPRIPRFTTSRISSAGFPLPDELVTQFKWTGKGSLATSSGLTLIGEHWFRAASLYDPDWTGAGEQPYYLDQLLGSVGSQCPYTRYYVYASKIKASFIQGSSNPVPVQVGLYAVSNVVNDLPTAPPDIAMLPRCKTAICGVQSQEVVQLENYLQTGAIDGYDQRTFNGMLDYYVTYGNNNPPSSPLWGILSQPFADTTTTIYYTVEIIYYVKLMTRNGYVDRS